MKTLLQIFDSLQGEQITECRKFLQSPYHCKEQGSKKSFSLLSLYEALVLTKGKEDLSDQLLFEAAYGKAVPYQKTAFSHPKSDLAELIQNYLVYQKFKQDELQQTQLGLEAIRLHRFGNFELEYQERLEAVEQRQWINADYWYQKFKLQEVNLRYYSNEKRDLPDSKALSDLEQSLDYAFITHKLRLASFLLSSSKGKQGFLEKSLLGFIEDLLQKQAFPLGVTLYWNCYQMLAQIENRETYYNLIKKQILTLLAEYDGKQIFFLTLPEWREIWRILTNFCIRKRNEGTAIYLDELYEWYIKGVKYGFIYENGFLTVATLGNIVRAAIGLEKYEEAEQLIEQNIPKIAVESQAEIKKFTLAIIYYRQGKKEEGKAILNNTKKIDKYKELEHYRTNIRYYYDNSSEILLDSTIDNFKAHLYRNKEKIDYHFDLNMNFLKYLNKIRKLNQPEEHKKIKKIIAKLENLPERQWFLDI